LIVQRRLLPARPKDSSSWISSCCVSRPSLVRNLPPDFGCPEPSAANKVASRPTEKRNTRRTMHLLSEQRRPPPATVGTVPERVGLPIACHAQNVPLEQTCAPGGDGIPFSPSP